MPAGSEPLRLSLGEAWVELLKLLRNVLNAVRQAFLLIDQFAQVGEQVLIGLPDPCAAAGGTLPWDQPLTTLQNDLQGAVAHAVTTAAIIGTGILWSVTEHGTGVRNLPCSRNPRPHASFALVGACVERRTA